MFEHPALIVKDAEAVPPPIAIGEAAVQASAGSRSEPGELLPAPLPPEDGWELELPPVPEPLCVVPDVSGGGAVVSVGVALPPAVAVEAADAGVVLSTQPSAFEPVPAEVFASAPPVAVGSDAV